MYTVPVLIIREFSTCFWQEQNGTSEWLSQKEQFLSVYATEPLYWQSATTQAVFYWNWKHLQTRMQCRTAATPLSLRHVKSLKDKTLITFNDPVTMNMQFTAAICFYKPMICESKWFYFQKKPILLINVFNDMQRRLLLRVTDCSTYNNDQGAIKKIILWRQRTDSALLFCEVKNPKSK